MADEIQSGLGRTGKMFGCDWEDVTPDVLIVGKALGGGVLPVSAVLASRALMDAAFQPGTHGSTFGGNPLACAVAREAIRVLVEEKLPERSAELGSRLMGQLRALNSPTIKEIRGRGLWIGVEIRRECGPARRYAEALFELGILTKETHEQVLRLAPPLVVSSEDLDWALERIAPVLAEPRTPAS
jgi:ornithine--oxo-acid transaminase